MVDASQRLDFDLISARAEDLPGMDRRSHIFWYDHPWVSSDVLLKMLFHMPPEQRGLQRNRTGDEVEYWSFPADYEARLEAVMDDLVEQATAQDGGSP